MNEALIKIGARIGLAAGFAISFLASANAALINTNGSFSGSLDTGTVTTTSTGTWLLGVTTTQIAVAGATRSISGAADPYLGSPNNLYSLNGGPIHILDPINIPVSTYNIANGPITAFTVTVDSLVLTLNQEVVTSLQNGNIGLAFVGTVTGAPAGFATGESADLSIGFTEAGPTGSIGVAISIDTPISPYIAAQVPEPGTISLLGFGLVGMIAVRRNTAMKAARVS
jgi:hypothetical protein